MPAACSQRVWSRRGAHEFGVAGALEQMVEAGEQLLGRQGLGAQAAANAAGQGQEVRAVELGGQAAVAGQDDGEDGAGVQVGAGEQAQFAEHDRVHFLGFIDEQDRAVEGGFDVVVPFFPQDFGAGPAVVRARGARRRVRPVRGRSRPGRPGAG